MKVAQATESQPHLPASVAITEETSCSPIMRITMLQVVLALLRCKLFLAITNSRKSHTQACFCFGKLFLALTHWI